MSYCRWSCDDFQCDVYCYLADDGYHIHVAKNRPVYAEPLPPKVSMVLDEDGWWKRFHKVREMLAASEKKNIDLPCDGESYIEATPAGAALMLYGLRCFGYNVPQYAIDALCEEAKEK